MNSERDLNANERSMYIQKISKHIVISNAKPCNSVMEII